MPEVIEVMITYGQDPSESEPALSGLQKLTMLRIKPGKTLVKASIDFNSILNEVSRPGQIYEYSACIIPCVVNKAPSFEEEWCLQVLVHWWCLSICRAGVKNSSSLLI